MGNYLGDISKAFIAVIKFHIYAGLGFQLPQTEHRHRPLTRSLAHGESVQCAWGSHQFSDIKHIPRLQKTARDKGLATPLTAH